MPKAKKDRRWCIVSPERGTYASGDGGEVQWTTDKDQAERLAKGIGVVVDADEFCNDPHGVIERLRKEVIRAES